MKVLAIDQSTTTTTAFLFRDSGEAETLLVREHRQIYPLAGWVEHDPVELLSHVTACVAAGIAAGAEVAGLANQGESCLAWDAETGRPVSPVLVWQDNRTSAACAALRAAHGAEITALSRLPGDPYFTAPKLRWILDNIPEAVDLHRAGHLRLGTTDAFFRDRLTGRFETDLATASRTALLDMETGQWSPRLCEIYGVPMGALPRITDCNGDLGTLQGLPLTASIVDQQAALFGHGLSGPGEAKVTFGTGAFALSLTGPHPPGFGSGALPTVAWREAGARAMFALDGGVHTASAALNWARDLGLFETFAELTDFGPGALGQGVAFVPALSGLACPHWDQDAKGVWLGLSLDTSRKVMMQAVLEGIAYRTREVLDAMAAESPLTGPLHVDGGMTGNPYFCQLLADVTGRDVQVSGSRDLTAFGVARLAARGAGADLATPQPDRLVVPDPKAEVFPERFTQARRLAQSWGQICAG